MTISMRVQEELLGVSTPAPEKNGSQVQQPGNQPSTAGIGAPWTEDEHKRFLEGLWLFPRGPWKHVARHVGTRTVRQTMTHAQKYRQKIARHRRGLKVHVSKQREPTAANDTKPSAALLSPPFPIHVNLSTTAPAVPIADEMVPSTPTAAIPTAASISPVMETQVLDDKLRGHMEDAVTLHCFSTDECLLTPLDGMCDASLSHPTWLKASQFASTQLDDIEIVGLADEICVGLDLQHNSMANNASWGQFDASW